MPKLAPLPSVPAGATASLYQPGDIWSHSQCPGVTCGASSNMCVQIQVAADSWNSGVAQTLLAQWTSGGQSWRLLLSATGSLQLQNCADGSTAGVTHAIAASTLGSPAAGTRLTLRVVRKSNDAGATTTAFYVSTNYDPIAKTGAWTQKGTTQSTAGVTAFFASTFPIQLGTYQDRSVAGNNLPLAGRFYWANVYDGVDDTGTLTAMIDNRVPWAGYENTTGVYIDAAGNKWRLQGFAAVWRWDYPVNQIVNNIPVVPISVKAGWQALSYLPFPMNTTNGGALAAGVWKYMPLTIGGLSPIKGLAVETAVAATAGTAGMQFAVFAADGAGGGPGTLLDDLSGSGSIDLTAAAGMHTLTLSASLALPDGTYWIGCMWTGTATNPPSMYGAVGSEARVVSASSAARNVNAYTQTSSTVPTPASPSSTSAGVIVYYQQ